MEFNVILCILACFLAMTQARSFMRESRASNPRDSERFKAFEKKFLQTLGMKEKPRVNGKVIIPQYMLDLYNSRVKDPEYISTNLVFKDFATTANTVRAYYHKDTSRKDGNVNRSRRNVHLDVSMIPSDEELVKAEFRVYNNQSNASLDKHVVNIYLILDAGVRKLLDSKIMNITSVGWQSYDVLHAVQLWHKTPGKNYGLQVEIMSQNGRPVDISHLHFDKPHEMAEEQWPHRRPLFTLYSRDPKTHMHKKRERRSTGNSVQWSKHKGLCQRFDMIVDFVDDLNWTWVVSPKRFNAYMCHGECRFPLASHMNTTNHAIVQTIVHKYDKYKKKVPPACCVPTELESFMLLFTDDNGGVQIREYANMLVTGCGCR